MQGGHQSGGRFGVSILFVLALTGCGATRAPSPGDTMVNGLTSPGDRARLAALSRQRIGQQSDPDQGYRIGPDDLLEIAVPDLTDAMPYHGATATGPGGAAVATVEAAPTFRQGVRVDALGTISIPQIGAVPAAGLTARQLENDIALRLKAAGILNNPEVSVTIVEHRSHVVAVVDSVQRPGLYPLTRPQATIADMIWAAGGPSPNAGRIVQFTAATVPPPSAQVDGSADPAADVAPPAQPIRIDLDLLLRSTEAGVPDLNAPVRPGDVISIAPAGVVLVDGWVAKPGSYPVTRNLTLTGTIAAADRSRATVKRTLSPSEESFMTVDLHAVDDRQQPDLPIIDGDVVYLPASGAKLVPWGIWQFFSTIFRVGASVLAF